MKLEISEIYVYPIKSLGGVKLEKANFTDTGIEYDRFWMLIDENGVFITQRQIPKLALFNIRFASDSIIVEFENHQISIPKVLNELKPVESAVWGSEVTGYKESDSINEWFSKLLDRKVCLIRNAKKSERKVKHHSNTLVNFSDSQQY